MLDSDARVPSRPTLSCLVFEPPSAWLNGDPAAVAAMSVAEQHLVLSSVAEGLAFLAHSGLVHGDFDESCVACVGSAWKVRERVWL